MSAFTCPKEAGAIACGEIPVKKLLQHNAQLLLNYLQAEISQEGSNAVL
jgi:hypothetical protein